MLFSLTSETNNGHDFTIPMENGIVLAKGDYEVSLISGMVCYGWGNITAALGNNIFKYRISEEAEWITITLPDGTYTASNVGDFIKKAMRDAMNYDPGTDTRPTATSDDIYYIVISPNEATGRMKITIANNYQLDLTVSKIWQVLGFNSNTILSENGEFESPNIPDFNRGVNQVQIRCSLVANTSSYTNGKPSQVLYSFNPDANPYEFISVNPSVPVYLPVITRVFDNINIKITDQNGNSLTTGGERTSILINIKRI